MVSIDLIPIIYHLFNVMRRSGGVSCPSAAECWASLAFFLCLLCRTNSRFKVAYPKFCLHKPNHLFEAAIYLCSLLLLLF